MNRHPVFNDIPPAGSTRFLYAGPFTVDLQTRHVVLDDEFVPLPACAFDCLVTLLRHSPEPVSYKTLAAESKKGKLTELDAQDLTRMLVYMLRKAVEPDIQKPRYIISVPGYGYRVDI
ncbi:MAG: winged helix-turn-helix domain-containing protein [Omnitrophica WOR_2 bacterium]